VEGPPRTCTALTRAARCPRRAAGAPLRPRARPRRRRHRPLDRGTDLARAAAGNAATTSRRIRPGGTDGSGSGPTRGGEADTGVAVGAGGRAGGGGAHGGIA